MILEEALKNFNSRLSEADQLVGIGSEVGNLTVDLLESLMKQYKAMPAFLEYKQKLQTKIDIIKNIREHPSLKEKYYVIYSQVLILVVANFEAFLNEAAIEIFNNYPYLVNWPESKVSLDLSVFNYSAQTVGDLILRSLKEKYTFQDLQSTLKFLKDYFSIEIELDIDLKEKIILYQAQRHTLIHNSGKVDEKYLKQIRDTKYASKYSKGKSIIFVQNNYEDAKAAFSDFANQIASNFDAKLDALPF